jgi:UDPglucose--hexose-1-phosphate uridylyltransferase
VVVAPGRARRPGAFLGAIEEPTRHELETCPFCEGREDRTPPETLALGRPDGAAPDGPGWTVRVVPNLYPALERQEVVVHSPRHIRSFADLADAELEATARAWRERASAARSQGFGYVHALVNEGALAGASLAHSHSQLVWLREPPPAVADEGDAVASLLDAHVVAEYEGLVLAVHPAGWIPYHLVLAPRERAEGAFGDQRLTAALRLLREAVRRLRAVEGALPWNAALHDGRHWHVEVLPRLTQLAGLELGAGIYVNVVAPEGAARALRDAGEPS